MIFKLTSTDLNNWADVLEARSLLPRMVRQLILLQKHTSHLVMPSDEDTQLGGYDGIVEFSGTHDVIPTGNSVWEFGVNKDFKTKAEDDYLKRTFPEEYKKRQQEKQQSKGKGKRGRPPKKQPAPLQTETVNVTADPTEVADAAMGNPPQVVAPSTANPFDYANHTFVFVTLRKWSEADRSKWQVEKMKDGKWKDVRVYAAEDLAKWLETAPVVAAWVKASAGKHPKGIVDLETWWLEYASATEPTTIPNLLLAGRKAQKEKLFEILDGEARVLSIQGENKEHALAFLAAAIMHLPEESRAAYLNRCVVVTDQAALRALAQVESPLVLIPEFENPKAPPPSRDRHHHVVSLSDVGSKPSKHTIVLPPLEWGAAHQALYKMGVSDTRTSELARLGRRNLLALRRKLAKTSLGTPTWAEPGGLSIPEAIFLAGAWQDKHTEDQKVLSRLSNLSYPELRKGVMQQSRTVDPPFLNLEGSWVVTAPEEAWDLLGEVFTADDLDNFESLAVEVLTAPPVELNVPFKVQAYARVPLEHSTELIQGMVDTLMLMEAHDSSLRPLRLATRTARVVEQVLGKTATLQRWVSLNHQLQSLAQAAPEAFLSAAEHHLASGEFSELFQDKEPTFMGNSPHVRVLWALEVLAWYPKHLKRVMRLLVRLHELDVDPSDRHGNRPIDSIVALLSTVLPGSVATIEQRIALLDEVRALNPILGRTVTQRLLPGSHMTFEMPKVPRWSKIKPEEYPQDTDAQIFAFSEQIVTRLLNDMQDDPATVTFMLDHVHQLYWEQRDRLLARLLTLNLEQVPLDLKHSWLAKFREYERFKTEFERVTFPREQQPQVDLILQRLRPQDPVEEWAWVFEHAPTLPGVKSDYSDDQYWQNVWTLQSQVFNILARLVGIEGVCRWAELTGNTSRLGKLLTESQLLNTIDEQQAFFIQHLGNLPSVGDFLARTVVAELFYTRGQRWLTRTLESILPNLTSEQQASFFLGLPTNHATWDAMNAFGVQVVDQYWKEVPPHQVPVEDHERALEQLLLQRRGRAVIDLLFSQPQSGGMSQESQVQILERLPDEPWPGDPGLEDLHDFKWAQVMKRLVNDQTIDRHRLVQLELRFPVSRHFAQGQQLIPLVMSTSAETFMQVLKTVYPPENASVDKKKQQRAREILRTWKGFPGLVLEDSHWVFRGEDCQNWFAWAKQLSSADTHLEESFLWYATEILTRAPRGEDGVWPHPAVCKVIEGWKNERFDVFLKTAILNSRGFTLRSQVNAGEPEQTLAGLYQEFAVKRAFDFHRTAEILEAVAEHLKDWSEDENRQSNLDQDFMG